MFRGEAVPSRAKEKNLLLKRFILFTQTHRTVWNMKKLLAYVYRMLLSFSTSLTYNFFLTSRWISVFIVKQPSSDITQFFAGRCSMSGANIQACCYFNSVL